MLKFKIKLEKGSFSRNRMHAQTKHKNVKFAHIFNRLVKEQIFLRYRSEINGYSGIDVKDLLGHWPQLTG